MKARGRLEQERRRRKILEKQGEKKWRQHILSAKNWRLKTLGC